MKYLFFIGRSEAIALSELKTILGTGYEWYKYHTACFELPELPEGLQDKLGGTIKIAEVLWEGSEEEVFENMLSILKAENPEGKKWTLALNAYGALELSGFTKTHLPALKKECGFPLRFCNHQFANVSSVVTFKQVLTGRGTEFNVCILPKSENKTFVVSKTISCQNSDAYGIRDYEKPVRDAKNGMLPPKLAQMLINLAGNTTSIWDPFCGTGTLLMEAVLMGKKVKGSDKETKMAEASQENITWLESLTNQKFTAEIFPADARGFVQKQASAIVTEGYLGKPRHGSISEREARELDEELASLYTPFFSHAKKLGIPCIILCLPIVFTSETQKRYMEKTLAKIHASGYNPSALSTNDRGSLEYARERQWVHREIFKFTL